MQNNETAMKAIWDQFHTSYIPVHSFLAEQGGTLLLEQYKEPYDRSTLHRMFSITKSFTSLAIGHLLSDGLIALDDSITSYFPEYRPSEGYHPWQAAMTIRHMLTMETCYSATTYKTDPSENWVESFFTTAPSHRSGQIFLYDTSSSHTLAALVKKLTQKGVLEYLREKFLDEISFSKDAYILSDPFDSEMGGSGLMACPIDLIKVGRYLLDTLKHGTDSFTDYLREAVSFQVPTMHSGQTLDEQQGYGYQFWSVRGGFAMFGMGGQYLLCYPESDLVCVITADTQNIKGGTQQLLDILYRELPSLSSKSKQTPPCSLLAPQNLTFYFAENAGGFSNMELSLDNKKGVLILHGNQYKFTIPFSFDSPACGLLEKYHQKIAAQAIWIDSDTLYLPVQITDECIGSIHIALKLSSKYVTLWMRKIEETYFDEFQGFWEGVCSLSQS